MLEQQYASGSEDNYKNRPRYKLGELLKYETIQLKLNGHVGKDLPTGDSIIEAIVYYYDIKEAPKEYHELEALKMQLDEWEGKCNQNKSLI